MNYSDTLSKLKEVLTAAALLLAAGYMSALCGCSTQSVSLAAPESRKPAPAWELKDLEGKPVKSADFKGKVVLLDFWATWCGPCREEIPGFVELQTSYSEQGLVIVGASLDEEGARVIKPFMDKMRINYPIVLADAKVQKDFGGIEAIPTTFLIDRSGRIAAEHVGFVSKAAFEREISTLLKE